MKRDSRLQAAKKWLATYPGKNVVKGYRKKFAVDIPCAIKELQHLGVPLEEKYVTSTLASYRHRIEKRAFDHRQRSLSSTESQLLDSDSHFAFIAGYTSGGAPYGISWREWEIMEEGRSSKSVDDSGASSERF